MGKRIVRRQPKQAGKKHRSVADQVEREQLVSALEKRRAKKKLTRSDLAAIRRYEQQQEEDARDDVLGHVPQHVLCELLATDRKVVRDWEGEGLPFVTEGRQKHYDLRVVLPWLKKRWLTGDGDSVAGVGSKRSAQIKLLVAREAEIQLGMHIKNGRFRDRHEVEAENAQKVTAVRAGLEALRRALAPAVLELGEDATAEEAEAIIWDHIEPLLKAFAGKRNAG